MNYTWNKTKPQKQMEYLLSLHEGLSAIEEKNIREAVAILKIILEQEKKRQNNANNSFLTKLELFDEFGSFIDRLIEASRTYIKYDPKDLEYKSIDLEEDQILHLTDEFYSRLDNKWYDLFQKVFKERKLNVKFSDSYPNCIHIPYLDYFYINLRKTNTVEDVICPSEIYGQAVSTLINPSNEKMYYKSIIIKVPEIFLGLVACNKFKGVSSNPKEYNIYQKNLFDTMAAYTEDVESDYHNFRGERTISNGIDQRITKYEMENISTRDKITGSISFLIAVELLYIYYENPKEAFDILNRIIELDDSDKISEQLAGLGINPGYSLEKYAFSLHNKIEKK